MKKKGQREVLQESKEKSSKIEVSFFPQPPWKKPLPSFKERPNPSADKPRCEEPMRSYNRDEY